MKKLTLALTVAVLLLSVTAGNVAAQTRLSINEWFADNTLDIKLKEGLSISPKVSVNLTKLAGAYDITDKIAVNALYGFGTTDSYSIAGRTFEPIDVTMLQIGGSYEIRDGIRIGAGYLSNEFEDVQVTGAYAEASGTLPLADNLTLTGKVGFSPMLEAKQKNFREEATLTSVDLGVNYNWNNFELSGGYRYQDYAMDINHISGSYSFSGMYVGAAYNF